MAANLARRGADGAVGRAAGRRRAGPRAAHRGRGHPGRARPHQQGRRRGPRAPGATARPRRPRPSAWARSSAPRRGRAARDRGRAATRLLRRACPTWPRTRRPTAARTTPSRSAGWASRRPSASPSRDHVELATAAGRARPGGRRPRLGRPLRLPARAAGARCSSRSSRSRSSTSRRPASRPSIPPVLVREEAMYGTGFFPTDRASIYETADDDLYLVGTSEVPLAGLHGEQIVAEADLPLRYGGISTCFRREAGAAGRDTRGIFRVHQFDKVEMFSFVLPGGLARRAPADPGRAGGDPPGDRGAVPGDRHRGRRPRRVGRAQVRLRGVDARAGRLPRGDLLLQLHRLPGAPPAHAACAARAGTETVHTLNGTAVAVGRTIIAILENHQREDGSVAMPGRAASRTARPRRSGRDDRRDAAPRGRVGHVEWLTHGIGPMPAPGRDHATCPSPSTSRPAAAA